MKSKKLILIAITILVACLFVACGSAYWNNTPQSSRVDDDYVPFVGGQLVVTSDGNFHTTRNPENLATTDGGTRFYNNILHLSAEFGVPKSVFEELAREHDARITSFTDYSRHGLFGDSYTFTFNRTFTLRELRELAEELIKLDFVEDAWPSVAIEWNTRTTTLPSGSRWRNNWGLEAVSAPSAWEYIDKMADAYVLVLDTGFYRNHQDLNFMVNLVEHTPHRTHRHGTHVAGIIGAEFDRGIEVSGIAPNSFMYGVSVPADMDELMEIIDWYVREHGVRVINYSMGDDLLEFATYRGNRNAIIELNRRSRILERGLQALINDGYQFIFVAGAGNQHERNLDDVVRRSLRGLIFVECAIHCNVCDDVCYGFRQDNEGNLVGVGGIFCPFAKIQNQEVRSRIISVGAVDENRNLTWFSQRCDNLMDVSAPGSSIYSTTYVTVERNWFGIGGEREVSHYGPSSGTSQAAPFVSGLATMLFGINPDFTGEEVKQIIVGTSDERNNNMINAYQAVRAAMVWDDVGQTGGTGAGVGGQIAGVAAIREAYMEFMRQRGFEEYFDIFNEPMLIAGHYYAIIDIDGNGIPELIIARQIYSDTGYFPDMVHFTSAAIFFYHQYVNYIYHIADIEASGTLGFSAQHNALTFHRPRGSAAEVMLATFDIWPQDFWYTISSRNPNDLYDIEDIEFLPIPEFNGAPEGSVSDHQVFSRIDIQLMRGMSLSEVRRIFGDEIRMRQESFWDVYIFDVGMVLWVDRHNKTVMDIYVDFRQLGSERLHLSGIDGNSTRGDVISILGQPETTLPNWPVYTENECFSSYIAYFYEFDGNLNHTIFHFDEQGLLRAIAFPYP